MTELLCDYELGIYGMRCNRLAHRIVTEALPVQESEMSRYGTSLILTVDHPRCKRHSRKWKVADEQRLIRDITDVPMK